MYGQGKTWETCRPAGFMSKKFSPAQFSYKTWDWEALAIIESLQKWEDKLLGRWINMVTDHKVLGFFKDQTRLSGCQARWMEYMEQFDCSIMYIKGKCNKVADCLSHYYMNDVPDETHPAEEYVKADVHLDPNGDELPCGCLEEVRALQVRTPAEVQEAEQEQAPPDPQVGEATLDETHVLLRLRMEGGDNGMQQSICDGYKQDCLFKVILDAPENYTSFKIRDNLIFSKNSKGDEVLCVHRTLHKGKSIPGIITNKAHVVLRHMGMKRTTDYVCRYYWWPSVS